ncbi:MAG: hypothetical protein NVSMB54_24340 [Ktedonobacteraceae bacterium]
MRNSVLEQITLEFTYLTTFHRGSSEKGYGTYPALLPLPHYVFPNLAKRWEDIAPPNMVGMIQRQRIEEYAHQDGIIITNYDLQPHRIHFTTHVQHGFVGRCTYRVRDSRRVIASRGNDAIGEESNEREESPLTIPQQLWLLSQLAFYSGIDYKTSMGMGRAYAVVLTYRQQSALLTGCNELDPYTRFMS